MQKYLSLQRIICTANGTGTCFWEPYMDISYLILIKQKHEDSTYRLRENGEND